MSLLRRTLLEFGGQMRQHVITGVLGRGCKQTANNRSLRGSFFQEWSALFVVPEESGGRIVFHYPRLQPATPAAESNFAIATRTADAAIQGVGLRASFTALSVIDPNDNEQVLSYRSYFPAPSAAVY